MNNTTFSLIISATFVILFLSANSLTDPVKNSASTQLVDNTYTYSLVHLSDLQNLATSYPDTYENTFSYLEYIKKKNNISAIIITGDLVNTYNNREEWDVYATAVKKTSIPIYTIAGNHDTNSGKDDRYYTEYTGNTDRYFITSLNNFNLAGISYVNKTLPSNDLKEIKHIISTSSLPLTIIATHYYMDKNGDLSSLGKDIYKNLILEPTIIMAGHKHAQFIQFKQDKQIPVIEEITNFQEGLNGDTGQNYSAGTFYSVTVTNGNVSRITAQIIDIFPEQKFGPEKIIFPNNSYSDSQRITL